MIWLTWRQHRLAALVAILMLLIFSSLLIYDNYTMAPLVQKLRLFNCENYPLETLDTCNALTHTYDLAPVHSFLKQFSLLFAFTAVLLVGIFIGAPLVAREREQSTHRLIWTQGTTSSRWITTKLGLIAGATLLAFGLSSILTAWWNDSVFQHSIWASFHSGIIVFPAYALFALTLGVLASTLIRRTIPAMTVTFILVVVIFTFSGSILNNYMQYIVPPKVATTPASNRYTFGAWSSERMHIDGFYADHNGNKVEDINKYCNLKVVIDPYGNTDEEKLLQCEREKQIQWKMSYYSLEHFLPTQMVFASFLVVLSLLFTAISFWWLRRQIS